MANDERPSSASWWQTLPGMLTAVAGVITAVAGLVIALNQAGVLGGGGESASAGAEARPDAARQTVATDDPAAVSILEDSTGTLQQHAVDPAAVTLGEATLTVLEATSRPRAPGTRTLEFTVRMLNHGPYPMNFWDDSFRLLVDSLPRAPIGGLNEVVQGRSAAEGTVVFVVPDRPWGLVLRLTIRGETADLRIDGVRAGG